MKIASAESSPTGELPTLNRILILFAHPAFQRSRANKRLVAGVRDLEGVTFHDLYEEYPDFNIDVKREQELLRQHDILVFQHPLYWYSSPAILKEWQDLVLEFGYAYGDTGTALQGKKMLTAITTGGSVGAYGRDSLNRFTIHELLGPFNQTAVFCGMEYLPPFVVHGTLQLEWEDHMSQLASDYRDALIGLRDGTLDLANLHEGAYLNDALPRDRKTE